MSEGKAEKITWAVKNGDLEQVKNTLEQDKSLVQASSLGRTPLHYAADYGQAEVMEYLISKGADINALDKHGISPLLAAIYEGHEQCVKLLISKGASKTGTGPDGETYINSTDDPQIKALLM